MPLWLWCGFPKVLEVDAVSHLGCIQEAVPRILVFYPWYPLIAKLPLASNLTLTIGGATIRCTSVLNVDSGQNTLIVVRRNLVRGVRGWILTVKETQKYAPSLEINGMS